MNFEAARRAVLGALVAGGTGGIALSPAGDRLDQFTPFSGTLWDAAERVPETVESEYGSATVTYDERASHVPDVKAATEDAAYFAVGFAQATDRLFEMDLIRRRMCGTPAPTPGNELSSRTSSPWRWTSSARHGRPKRRSKEIAIDADRRWIWNRGSRRL